MPQNEQPYALKVSGDFTRLESQADFDEWCKVDNVRVFERYHKPLSFPCVVMTVDEMIDTGSPPNEYQTTVPVPHFLYPANVRALAELLPEPAEKYSDLTPRDFGVNIPFVPDAVWRRAFAPSETGWYVQVGAHNEAPSLKFYYYRAPEKFVTPLLIAGPFETLTGAKREFAKSASEWQALMPTVEIYNEIVEADLLVLQDKLLFQSVVRDIVDKQKSYVPLMEWAIWFEETIWPVGVFR